MLPGPFVLDPAFKFGKRKCIQHIGFGRPTPPGGGNTVTHQTEAVRAVSISSDGQLDTCFDCHPAVNVLQVQTPRISIDFQRGVRLGGVVYDSSNVKVHRLALADEPSRWVADTIDVGVFTLNLASL